MAKKCARTFSIVVEKGKKSILEVRHLLPVGIARYVRPELADSNLHAVKMTQNWALLTPPLSRAAGPAPLVPVTVAHK